MTIGIILLWLISVFLFLRQSLPHFNTFFILLVSFLFGNVVLAELYSLSFLLGISFMIFQLFLLLITIIILLKLHRDNAVNFPWLAGEKLPLLPLCFLGIGVYFFTLRFFEQSQLWGVWDALAIWTFHAKFLVSQFGLEQLYFNKHSWPHADYPLMLPALIGLYWKSFGTVNPYVPLLIAYATSISIIALTFLSFLQKKMHLLAIALVLLFSFTDSISTFAIMQYADLTLASLILVTVILHEHKQEKKSTVLIFLLGFFAASCAWIKNEGALYCAIFSILLLLTNLKNKRLVLTYFAGCIGPVFLLILFKLKYAPDNDLISGQSNGIESFLTIERLRLILAYVRIFLYENLKILLLLLTISLLINTRYFKSFGFLLLFMVFNGYLFVYLNSPHDLTWHLQSSFNRVFFQITPALIYTCCASLGNKYFAKEATRL